MLKTPSLNILDTDNFLLYQDQLTWPTTLRKSIFFYFLPLTLLDRKMYRDESRWIEGGSRHLLNLVSKEKQNSGNEMLQLEDKIIRAVILSLVLTYWIEQGSHLSTKTSLFTFCWNRKDLTDYSDFKEGPIWVDLSANQEHCGITIQGIRLCKKQNDGKDRRTVIHVRWIQMIINLSSFNFLHC